MKKNWGAILISILDKEKEQFNTKGAQRDMSVNSTKY